MGKKAQHIEDLGGLVDGFVRGGSPQTLTAYLLSNSNLPGRRGNIELAEAFGDVVEALARAAGARLWELCLGMTGISAEEAPVNTAEEFLPFCGTVGLGALGATCPEFYDSAVGRLRTLAGDPRWRMREAVCFGLQRLLAQRCSDTLAGLEGWVRDGNPLEMRAAAAAVAEPRLLVEGEVAARALQLHAEIFAQFPGISDRRAEAFRILRKGLGYTLSVVVAALPQAGFAFVQQLAVSDDGDVRWILKQNLKKKRIASKYPQQVEAIQQRLA
jgi:hypothetical protein